jgi:hypothetical protein
LIINNRPDGEEPNQPLGVEIEKAATAAGMDYRSVPIIRGIGPRTRSDAGRDCRKLRKGSGFLPERYAFGTCLGPGQERRRHGTGGDRAAADLSRRDPTPIAHLF